MSNTLLIFKDELRGFAVSWVMIALWVGLPLLSIILYFVLPGGFQMETLPGMKISMTFFIGVLISSLGGTLASIMLAVDIVNEKNRKVYDLFVIRPLKPGSILWAKFMAVVICVSFACLLSLAAGMLVDTIQGVQLGWLSIRTALEAFATCVGVMMISAAGGVIVGAVSPSVLISVLLVLYGTQNLALIPMAPTYFGFPDYLWLMLALTLGVSALIMWGAATIFNKKEF
jgi:ABC-type transport system involved in multi-copper enzyme maturation permease subunit